MTLVQDGPPVHADSRGVAAQPRRSACSGLRRRGWDTCTFCWPRSRCRRLWPGGGHDRPIRMSPPNTSTGRVPLFRSYDLSFLPV